MKCETRISDDVTDDVEKVKKLNNSVVFLIESCPHY